MELGNLKNDEITSWAPFGEDGEILMRYLSSEELRDIQRRATERVWVKHQPIEELNRIEQNRLLGRAAVRGWKNLTVGREPLPYNPDNCDLLMLKSYDFCDFVNLVCVQIKFFIDEKEEEKKKESESTPGGS